jgi:hypothetical protein
LASSQHANKATILANPHNEHINVDNSFFFKRKNKIYLFSKKKMTTLSVVVLVAATVLVASAADDFCKAANHRDRVRCDKDTLTWCKGESVAATNFCGQSNCVNGAWSKSSDPAINAVPSYCKQFTKEFFLQQMGPEREKKWGCHDTMQRYVCKKKKKKIIKIVFSLSVAIRMPRL